MEMFTIQRRRRKQKIEKRRNKFTDAALFAFK